MLQEEILMSSKCSYCTVRKGIEDFHVLRNSSGCHGGKGTISAVQV